MHRILIVDDDRMNQLLAKKFLSGNYIVDAATSGAAALEYLKEKSADLILLDLMMPEMDGFEVIRRLQLDPKTASIPVIFLTADRSEKVEEACFKAGCADFISKPFLPAVMVQRVRRTLELEDYRKDVEQCVSDHVEKLTRSLDAMIIGLANLIDRRDGNTGGHIRRSSSYIRMLTKKLFDSENRPEGFSHAYADTIMRAAPLFDIGKITVPESILQKPGKLTSEEFEKIKAHTTAGSDIIRESLTDFADKSFVEIAANMAAFHHERWDGSGYPKGLKGEEIPLCARIAAVADVFDALVSKSYYKSSLSFEDAVGELLRESGKYDPVVLDLFVNSKDELMSILSSENIV